MEPVQGNQQLKHINYRVEDRVGIIEFNRPPKNAIDDQLLRSLSTILNRWRDDDSVSFIVLTGAIRNAFLSGADTDALFGQQTVASIKTGETKLFHEIQKVFIDLETAPQVTIAAINGVCMGAGLEMALCCDLRIASELAYFGLPETNYGITTIAGTTQRLPWLIGAARAKEMFLLGKRINAQTALDWGLINRIAPHKGVLAQSLSLAHKLSQKPDAALRAIKQCVNFSAGNSFQEGVHRELETFIRIIRLWVLNEKR